MSREKYQEKIREENAIVLDYLAGGLTSLPVYRRYPVAQMLGTQYFVLLEVTPKEGVEIAINETVYVGDGERDKAKTIRRRLKYDELTSTAKSELPAVVESIIEKDKYRFVDFFNKATALSLKHHQLELLPKVGKKHMYKILEEREIEPFKSFEDIDTRVKGLPNSKKLIIDRILEEIEGEEERRLFVPDFGSNK